MEWLYATLIKKKLKTLNDVPERYKDGVIEYLILWGLYEPNNNNNNGE